MSFLQKIIGYASGNGLEVDSNNRAKVNLPTTKADAGYAALTSVVHDGLTGQAAPIVRNLEVSINKRLRVGLDNLWFQDRFSYAAQWTAVWKSTLTTMTVTHVPAGFIALNGGGSVAAAAVANYETRKRFPCYNGAGLALELIALWNQPPQTGNMIEFGLFQAATTAAPLDGILFRLTSAGVLNGVTNFSGSETLVDLGTVPSEDEAHSFGIRVEQESTIFLIDGVVRGSITTPPGQNGPANNMYQPIHFRNYNSGATSLAQQFQVGEVRVFMRDVGDARPFGQSMAGMGGMGCQGHAGATQGSTALYTNSMAIGAGAAATNTTAALGSGLGGQFGLLPTLTAGSDGIISSYLVPAGTALIPGESLVITGVWIDAKVLVILAGGPLYFAMSLAIGGDAVTLAQSEAAATKAHRRIPLGFLSFPVTAAVGTKPDEGRIFVPFASPLVVNPGEYVQVVAKNMGTVTTTGQVVFLIGFDSHWE
jgi:hypothetical protein